MSRLYENRSYLQKGEALRSLILHGISCIVAAYTASSLAQAGPPSFQGIGHLPEQVPSSFFLPKSQAFAVSADGSTIVGSSSELLTIDRAISWASGKMERFADLPGLSAAYDVSADGGVIVGAYRLDATENTTAYKWENGLATDLGDLPGGARYSMARAVSASGSIIVGESASALSGSFHEAFRWKNGVIKPLGDLSGGAYWSAANDVSADGSIIVGHGWSSDGREAFRYQDEIMTGLGDLPGGGFLSRATAISEDSSTIVGVSMASNGLELVRWRNGATQPESLEILADADGQIMEATDVNIDGKQILGYMSTTNGLEAFLWDEADGIRTMTDVLVNDYGLDLSGWQLTQARGMSSDGRTIIGIGVNPVGDTEGWVARVPEPSLAGYVICGLLGRCMCSRRRC